MTLLHLGATWPIRRLEWFLGAVLCTFGCILMRPESTFALSSSFDAMAAIMTEGKWAIACTIAGAARLCALVLDETWTPWSFYLRSITSAFSALVFFSITYSLIAGGLPTTGLSVYPWCFIAELACIFQASRDATIARLVDSPG
jgi:hypothetical protein